MSGLALNFDLAVLGEKAQTLVDTLWDVNDRRSAVAWCADADAVLMKVAKLLAQPEVREAIAKAIGAAS